jgi:hypothetical protein
MFFPYGFYCFRVARSVTAIQNFVDEGFEAGFAGTEAFTSRENDEYIRCRE